MHILPAPLSTFHLILYSHDLNGWFNHHTVRRNKTLVTLTLWKGYVGSLSFSLTFHDNFKSYFVSFFFYSLQNSQHDRAYVFLYNGLLWGRQLQRSLWSWSRWSVSLACKLLRHFDGPAQELSQLICELKVVKYSFCFRVWQETVENTR